MDLPTCNILLLCDDSELRRRLARALESLGNVSCAVDDLPADLALTLLITDTEDAMQRRPAEAERHRSGELGVISLGGGSGDVSLPSDATPREVQLAARLLTELVQLRQSLRRGARERRQLAQLANSDALTGLPNRRALEEEFRRRAVDFEQGALDCLCFALFDLDYFKRVNDQHGHTAGDALLVAAGTALQQHVRKDDFVARFGGDEFAMLLGGVPNERAHEICDRVRRDVIADLAAAAVGAKASIGFAGGACSGADCFDTWYAAASDALRTAKQTGRDRTCGVQVE